MSSDPFSFYPYSSYLFIILAYLIGSIPVGVILGKAKGTDPRTIGSGNIGATNVMRAAGKMTGMLTLVGDVLKGLIPVVLVAHAGEPRIIVVVAGLAAFLGHLFPIFLRFRGGKGVATALGVYIALDPFAIIIAAIVFVAVLVKWQYVSLGSLVGVAAMPVLLYLLNGPAEYIYLSLIMGTLIFVKHRENIGRLLAGTENKITG